VTLTAIKQKIQQISQLAEKDPVLAHHEEDKLHLEVFQFIARMKKPNPIVIKMAKMLTELDALDFERSYG